MDIFGFNPSNIMSFLMTFMRMSLLVFLLPFFGGETIPRSVKASLCLVMTLALWPHMSFPGEQLPASMWNILLLLLGELLLGMTLGLVVHFLFAAIRTGGQIVGFQMGFAMVNIVDPMTGASNGVAAHFLYMVSLLVFLSLDGHLLLLQTLTQSFDMVPFGGIMATPALASHLLELSADLFVLAVKIAAPIMASLFLVDVGLALVARAAPQMHVLIIGFPLKISVGFFFLGMLFTVLASHMRDYVITMGPMFMQVLRLAG